MEAERVGVPGVRWGPIASATGIAFVILALVAFLLAGGPEDSSAAEVRSYFTDNESAIEWQALVFGVSGIFFVWFAGTLAAALRSTEPDAGGRLGGIALAGATASTALYYAAVGAFAALAQVLAEEQPVGESVVLFSLGTTALAMANFAAAVFVGAASVALLSTRLMPDWLAWAGGLLVALLLVNGAVQLLGDANPTDALARITFLAFLAWVLVASGLLSRWWARTAGTRTDEVARAPR